MKEIKGDKFMKILIPFGRYKIIKKNDSFKIKFSLFTLKIRDIHPGYGGEIIAELSFKTSEEAEKMINFLKEKSIYCIRPIDWKVLIDCNFEYFY